MFNIVEICTKLNQQFIVNIGTYISNSIPSYYSTTKSIPGDNSISPTTSQLIEHAMSHQEF